MLNYVSKALSYIRNNNPLTLKQERDKALKNVEKLKLQKKGIINGIKQDAILINEAMRAREDKIYELETVLKVYAHPKIYEKTDSHWPYSWDKGGLAREALDITYEESEQEPYQTLHNTASTLLIYRKNKMKE